MFPLQGKAEVLSQNILRWEEKSKQPITAFFDLTNLPCPEGETLKGPVNTIKVYHKKGPFWSCRGEDDDRKWKVHTEPHFLNDEIFTVSQ